MADAPQAADELVERVLQLIEERLCIVWFPKENREQFADELRGQLKEQEAEIERLRSIRREAVDCFVTADREREAAEARADRAHDDAIEVLRLMNGPGVSIDDAIDAIRALKMRPR